MRFDEYIKENLVYDMPRSKDIDKDEWFASLKKYCKQAVKAFKEDRIKIYRGKVGGIYSFTNPRTGSPRRSANTRNYHTLIIDNSKEWKKFPKRSESIICSTDINTALSYGQGYVYTVFPYDEASIGMCKSPDWWVSFANLAMNGLQGVNSFNRILFGIFEYFGIKVDDKSWDSLKKGFEKLRKIDVNPYLEDFNRKEKFVIEVVMDQGVMDSFFSPQKNGHKLIDMKTYKSEKGVSREVWTDSKCLLTKSSYIKDEIMEMDI